MKTEEFIRIRRTAAINGWNVEQQSVSDSPEVVAIFKKTVVTLGNALQNYDREIRVFFEIEDDQTIVKGCYYNGKEIRMSQVRNLLENL